jgi:hypothetical protein
LLYKVFFLRGEEERKFTIKFNNPDGISDVTIYFLPLELKIYECNVISLEKVKENFNILWREE